MAQYDEQMNKRREKREAMRKKQQAERKRMQITLIAAAVVLVLCGAGLWFLTRDKLPAESQQAENLVSAETTEATRPKETEAPAPTQRSTTTTIHLKAAGDLNVTNSVVDSGLEAYGYDYTRAFQDVAPILADADLTFLNFEGNISGEPYGTETTSAPREIMEGLRNAGVDMIQMANSCSINNGLIGLSSTLQSIRASGLEPLGAYTNSSEFQQTKGYTMTEIKGVRVAFVAFTKGVGGMGLPAGNEDCVNLLYTDYYSTYEEIDREGITAVLKNVAAEKPDITVALLHWGSEYNEEISKTQESIVSLMKKEGVDVIIGTHPHLVQKVEFDESAGTLVAYSLGDFYGEAARAGTNYSIILDVEITKDTDAGTTKVTGFSYTPIYTLKESETADQKRSVVRIQPALNAYSGNFVDKISQSAYESMTYALTRIKARVEGE